MSHGPGKRGRGPGGTGPGRRRPPASPRPDRPARRDGRGSTPRGPGPPRQAAPSPTSDGRPALPRDVWRDSGSGVHQPATVGVLRRQGRFLVAEPLFERGRRVTVRRGPNAREGRIVVIRPDRKGHHVEREVGEPDVARDVLEALLLHHGLPRRVARAVGVEAEGVANAPPDLDRVDLRDLATFTIDPVTARDFDDAISAQELDPDGRGPATTRVWVHIADVAAHVRPDGALDRDARWRGTSVYVPGTVEPMLPPALSNDACSLVPGADRPAVTVRMDFVDGAVVSARVDRSVIRSDARLDYAGVDRIFAGTERAQDPWAEPLAVARRVAAGLQRRRTQTTTALELDTAEPTFAFDDAGHVVAIALERQTEAHRVIEHLMIAANEQVARTLDERGVPTLHRVHGLPEPESVLRLVDQLAALGIPTPPLGERPTREDAAAAVAEISRRVDQHVRRTGHGRAGLSYLVLRALQQARYEPKGLGHAGLGLGHYCHFTSPIRRYPDLVCHRAILSLVGGGEQAPAGSGLEELGIWCSATEREAMAIERDADRVARAFLLRRVLFEHGWQQTFRGEVSGVIGAGLFVRFGGAALDDEAFEGMLPVRRMESDWWELDELSTMLVGTRSGATIRLGDPIEVAIERIEPERGRVSLVPARGSVGGG